LSMLIQNNITPATSQHYAVYEILSLRNSTLLTAHNILCATKKSYFYSVILISFCISIGIIPCINTVSLAPPKPLHLH
jgi:hypothetical protein